MRALERHFDKLSAKVRETLFERKMHEEGEALLFETHTVRVPCSFGRDGFHDVGISLSQKGMVMSIFGGCAYRSTRLLDVVAQTEGVNCEAVRQLLLNCIKDRKTGSWDLTHPLPAPLRSAASIANETAVARAALHKVEDEKIHPAVEELIRLNSVSATAVLMSANSPDLSKELRFNYFESLLSIYASRAAGFPLCVRQRLRGTVLPLDRTISFVRDRARTHLAIRAAEKPWTIDEVAIGEASTRLSGSYTYGAECKICKRSFSRDRTLNEHFRVSGSHKRNAVEGVRRAVRFLRSPLTQRALLQGAE